jgi:hypothetical protein
MSEKGLRRQSAADKNLCIAGISLDAESLHPYDNDTTE